MKAIKYPSTSQFRQTVRSLHDRLTFDGIDRDGNVLRKEPITWVYKYLGTVKLHGTNGSIVYLEDGQVIYQSKANVLSLDHDNHGFMARNMHINHDYILSYVKSLCKDMEIPFEYPIEIAGEWAGRGIQKGVAIAEVDPFFAVFRIAVGKDDRTGMKWLSPSVLKNFVSQKDMRVYSILDFGHWEMDIDFSKPEFIINDLVKITEGVEKCCPAGAKFGVEGIGEGVVWSPVDPLLAKDSGLWFKVKGEKHSVTKTKTLVTVDPILLESIEKFVDYSVTENRLLQGRAEVGADIKKVGEFIGWVTKDVMKEEGDVMAQNGLIAKDVGKYIATKSRNWYMQNI